MMARRLLSLCTLPSEEVHGRVVVLLLASGLQVKIIVGVSRCVDFNENQKMVTNYDVRHHLFLSHAFLEASEQ